jgi:tetratricopeptide (TPR) repeat protein
MLTAMLDRKYRGRRKGVAVRAGSVRQARIEAHLSLAEVAGDRVSRTAIHLIEHGRTKPSFETLSHIASRTQKPMEYFLVQPGDQAESPAEIQELEKLTAGRQFDKVISLGEELVQRSWGPLDLASVRLYLGQAYCRLVRPNQALEHLPRARAEFERIGDEWMAVEALDWEASALGLLESPEAILLADQALERCRRLDPKPPQLEARILGHLAGMYVVRQSWSQAVQYYEAAVNAAGHVRDLLQQAKMHHGLGTAYQRMLQPVKARQHFDRALALYSIESELSAVYRVENDLGYVLMQEGRLDLAESHLRKALTGTEDLHIDRRGRGFVLTNLGEVQLRKGNLDSATDYLSQALQAGEASGERIVLAEARAVLARVEERKGNSDAADDHFATALEILEPLDMPDRLRDCHMEYAELLSARGDVAGAAQHWKLAAQIGKLASAGLKVASQQIEASAAG